MAVPDALVFDAEPLVAHAGGERGSDAVSAYLDAVGSERADGYVNWINLAETRYILARKYGRDRADEYTTWVLNLGVEPLDVEDVWFDASEFVLEYNPALGDSFALATATAVDATLLVGGDDDYDACTDVTIERFRDGAA